MELPDEIVKIIREYSRPRMRFVKEYNIAIRALKMTEWRKVQEKLTTNEAEKVINALDAYAMAVVELRYMQETEEVTRGTFNYQDITLEMFPRFQALWKDLIHIQRAILKLNKRRNDTMIHLGKMLVENYPRRWENAYREEEDEMEDTHNDMEFRYDELDYLYGDMESAYGWVREVYDN